MSRYLPGRGHVRWGRGRVVVSCAKAREEKAREEKAREEKEEEA